MDEHAAGEWILEDIGLKPVTAEEKAAVRVRRPGESLAERQQKYKILIAKKTNTKKGPYRYTRAEPNHVASGKIHHAPIHQKDYSLRPVIPNSDKIHVSGEESDAIVSIKTFGYVPPQTIYVSKVTPVGRVCDPSNYDSDTDDLIIQGRGVTL